MRAWGLVLAGGAGTRFGAGAKGAIKVLTPICGRSMVSWSVSAAAAVCHGVTLVVPAPIVGDSVTGVPVTGELAVNEPLNATRAPETLGADAREGAHPELGRDTSPETGPDPQFNRRLARPWAELLATLHPSLTAVVAGGDTRSASVRAGLLTVPDDVDVVICHDAARPGASAKLFAAVIQAVAAGADAAVPAVPVCDTLKRVPNWEAGGRAVTETVDRAELFAVQTPQAFRRDALVAAHAGAPEATDDAALIEAVGGTVLAVAGEASAHKVTTEADVAIVEALLSSRADR